MRRKNDIVGFLMFVATLLCCILALGAYSHARAADLSGTCGWDTDRDGSVDQLCPSDKEDRDFDGYATDCDDTDWQIYPGVTIDDGGTLKTCETDGTYTTVSGTLDESTGSGSGYYINCDAVSNGSGTYASPWNTLQMISYFEGDGDSAPAGHHNPVAGDAIYIWGTCDDTYNSGTSYGNRVLAMANRDGTESNPILLKNYPGETAVIDLSSGSAKGVYFLLADYWEVEGITITGSTIDPAFIIAGGGEHSELRNMYIYDNEGPVADNQAGASISGDNNTIHHSYFSDNYDSTSSAGSSENNANIVLFQSDNTRIYRNYLEYSTQPSALEGAYSIKYKHSDNTAGDNGDVEVDHNIIYNTANSIGTGQSGSHIHHNLFISSGGIVIKDHGGPYYLAGFNVEYNTWLNSTDSATVVITNDYDGSFGLNAVVTKYNVIYDNRSSFNIEDAPIAISTYLSNADYTAAIGKLTWDSNCYYLPNATFGVDYFSQGESSGDYYTFANWQSTESQDANSYVTDPDLDSYSRATASSCASWGHTADWTTATVPVGATASGASLLVYDTDASQLYECSLLPRRD